MKKKSFKFSCSLLALGLTLLSCVPSLQNVCNGLQKNLTEVTQNEKILQRLVPLVELPKDVIDFDKMINAQAANPAILEVVKSHRSYLDRSTWTKMTRNELDNAQKLLDFLDSKPEFKDIQKGMEHVANLWVIANGYAAEGKIIPMQNFLSQITVDLANVHKGLCVHSDDFELRKNTK